MYAYFGQELDFGSCGHHKTIGVGIPDTIQSAALFRISLLKLSTRYYGASAGFPDLKRCTATKMVRDSDSLNSRYPILLSNLLRGIIDTALPLAVPSSSSNQFISLLPSQIPIPQQAHPPQALLYQISASTRVSPLHLNLRQNQARAYA